MAQIDLEINRNVRRVFVRHWVDLGRIFIRSVNGRVSVRGALSRIHGMKDPITPTIVETIFNEVKRVSNVKSCTPDLENWINDSGAWKPKSKDETRPASNSQGIPKETSHKRYVIGNNQDDS